MGKLIKAECLKLSKLRSYKILLLCVTGLGVLVGCLLVNMSAGELPVGYGGQDGYSIYMSALADTEISAPFFLIFAALFVCTEFSNRTFGIGLFSGCLRSSVLTAKAIVFLIGLMPVVFAQPIMAGMVGLISEGLGNVDAQMWRALIRTTLLAVLGNASIGGFCFMLAVLIQNIGGTVGVGIGLLMGMDVLRVLFGDVNVVKLTFLYQSGSLLQMESVGLFIAVTGSTLLVTIGVSIIAFQKAELK